MRLSELLRDVPESAGPVRLEGGDPVVRGITYDSRAVSPGDLFVALRGATADGHDYLAQATSLGAAALMVEALPADRSGLPPVAIVGDSRRALAPVAIAFFGHPADELSLVGVTGTNGKTSTTYLVESMLDAAGISAGLIGTVEVRYAGERERALNTTPESLDLQRTLRAMCTRGVRTVAMEVSSHGIALGRVAGCRFRVAAFTNLTQDHLDFHETMSAYAAVKARLFSEHLAADGCAVIHVDDPSWRLFAEAAEGAGARVLRVGWRNAADAEVRVESAEVTLESTRARLRLPGGPLELTLPLLGDFNVENLVVAVGAACALGLAPEAIAAGAAHCPQVPGRMERVGGTRPGEPTVLVDYAHTPDAVEKLLAAARPLARGRLIAVFGCGGDRDRSKRPLMAHAVARYADRAIATSDNPRTEDPEAILDDVVGGLDGLARAEPDQLDGAGRSFTRLLDRRQAIGLALRIARPEDVVVLAGKGHEDYQIVGRTRLPFDDREEARLALARRAG